MKGHDARRIGQSLGNGPRNVDQSRTLSVEAPAGLLLSDLHSSPVSGEGRIRFTLPGAAHVRVVADLEEWRYDAGMYQTVFSTARWPSGNYFCRIVAGPANL